MATPKKKRPIKSSDQIHKAFKTMKVLETSNPGNKSVDDEINSQPDIIKKTTLGRKPTLEGRTTRVTFYLTQKTFDRFNLAFLKELEKELKKGGKTDKSLIFEQALVKWLDRRNY